MANELDALLAKMWKNVYARAREAAQQEIIKAFGQNLRGGALQGSVITGQGTLVPAVVTPSATNGQVLTTASGVTTWTTLTVPDVTPPARYWRQAISPTTPTFQLNETVISDGYYNAFASLTVDALGALVACYREGTAHISNDGKVTIQISTDGGATWGSKVYVQSPPAGHDYRDPGICTTSTGRMMINYFDAPGGTANTGVYTTYLDAPYTGSWSTPALQTLYTQEQATSGPILQHSGGVLVLPVYGQNTGDSDDQMGVVRSLDNGVTWSALINVTAASGGYSEATLIELPNHTIRAFLRKNSPNPGPLYTSDSTDAGLTWSAVTALSFNVYPGRPAAVLVPVSQTIVLFYRKWGSPYSFFRWSFDLGTTWSAETIYIGTPYMYASGVPLTDDMVGFAVAIEVGSSQADVHFVSLQVMAGGSVTSVGLALPGLFTVSGSPVTTVGTLTAALATQTQNLVFSGPASGSAAAPTFRALVAADLPLATTGAPGAVEPDGSTITISAGVISGYGGYTLPTASTSVLGGVEVDGTTITSASGVISAPFALLYAPLVDPATPDLLWDPSGDVIMAPA